MTQKRSLGISYTMKRKAKKMAEGGFVDDPRLQSDAHELEMVHSSGKTHIKGEEASGFLSHEGDNKKHDAPASHEDHRMLNQHGMYEEGDEGTMDGNMEQHEHMDEHAVENQGDHEDMVGRIMKQRLQHFSKGGMVANKDQGVSTESGDELADLDGNEMDDLALRDHLEFSETGANSGDNLGNKQQDHDRSDIISRIMESRKKKDKLPNPR